MRQIGGGGINIALQSRRRAGAAQAIDKRNVATRLEAGLQVDCKRLVSIFFLNSMACDCEVFNEKVERL